MSSGATARQVPITRGAAWAPGVAPLRAGSALLRRIAWGATVALVLGVWGLAAWLEPSSTGTGTHLQLGLPPCGVLLATGWPCPSCGLTTSFAHLAELDLPGAVGANPFGLALAATSVALGGAATRALWRGSPVVATLDRWRADLWAIALVVLGLVVWGVRLGGLLLARP